MAKYLKPLRGKFTSATQQDILLRKGEMFLCLLNSDNMGQGPGAIYIGDGISAFNSYTHNGSTVANTPQPFLIHPAKYNPIFANTNPSTASWTIDAATSEINNIGKGVAAVELPTIIGNIKAALCKHADSIVKLTNDRDDILDTLDDHERHLSDHDNSIATINETLASITEQVGKIYPVGSIYISTQMDQNGVPVNPSTYLGYGTWSLLAGNYVLKTIIDNNKGGSTYSAENTGGTSLQVEHLPKHTHKIEAQSGSGSASGGGHKHIYDYPNWEDTAAGDGGPVQTHNQKSGYSTYTTEGTGTHTHTVSVSIPAHYTNETGSGTAHAHESKIPRSIGVYVWRRTA
jgi:hypothetical protein